MLRPNIGKKTSAARSLSQVVQQVIQLHLIVASEFLESKVIPHVQVPHGLSMSIRSQSSLDINLALFEVLGRIGLTGLWIHWHGQQGGPDVQKTAQKAVVQYTQAGLALIRNNPALLLPIADRQGSDIALFLQLWFASGLDAQGVTSWLVEMAHRLDFTVRRRGRYPSCASDYRELAEHPRDHSDEYFKEATAGSTLIPLIAAWLQAFGQVDVVEKLSRLVREELEHCTLQLWMPDETSEAELYLGERTHGRALCDLPLAAGGSPLLASIAATCQMDTAFDDLSPIKTGFWPVFLVACHHNKLPIPPGFWIDSLKPSSDSPP